MVEKTLSDAQSIRERRYEQRIRFLKDRVAKLESRDAERAQVERALIKALDEWETTFNATRDAIMLVDNEFRIVQANGAASCFLDRSIGEILGKKCSELICEKETLDEQCPLTRAASSKKREESELYLEQTGRWVMVSADPVLEDRGDIRRFVFVLRDITDGKKSRRELEELNTQLQDAVHELSRSNTELQDFAHITAHDLKSPLRAVGSLAGLTLKKDADKLDEQGRERLNVLVGRVKRMSRLVDGILQYSEIGHVTTARNTVDLNEALTDAIAAIAPPKHVRITVEGPLPSLVCERVRMAQVFQNLLGNAVKYADKPKVLITVRCSDEGRFWKVEVADNGPGIKQEYFEKIFRIFQTLAPRDRVESTGVGLTVVRKIVEMYGGRIWVESELGKGSSFFFTLLKNQNGEQI